MSLFCCIAMYVYTRTYLNVEVDIYSLAARGACCSRPPRSKLQARQDISRDNPTSSCQQSQSSSSSSSSSSADPKKHSQKRTNQKRKKHFKVFERRLKIFCRPPVLFSVGANGVCSQRVSHPLHRGSASLRHRSFVPGGGNKRSVAGHEKPAIRRR